MEPIVGVLLGGVLLFNAVVTPGRAEKQAEKALRKKYPGATVNVEIEGKRGRDVLNGRFKNVRVELSNVKIDGFPIESKKIETSDPSNPDAPKVKVGTMGHLELQLRDMTFGDLPVKSASLSFDDVQYDFKALKKDSDVRLIAFSNGKIALTVEAPALVPTVSRRAPEILNPVVELSGGEIIVSGRREVLGLGANVKVRGAVVARGKNLEVDNPRVEVAGLKITPLIANPLLKGVNPLYKFDEDGKWPLNLQIERVTADQGLLQIEGALTLK